MKERMKRPPLPRFLHVHELMGLFNPLQQYQTGWSMTNFRLHHHRTLLPQ
jgi:hypothetical protein